MKIVTKALPFLLIGLGVFCLISPLNYIKEKGIDGTSLFAILMGVGFIVLAFYAFRTNKREEEPNEKDERMNRNRQE